MLLALILTLYVSSPLSKENAVGVRFQSHTEYKVIADTRCTKIKSERKIILVKYTFEIPIVLKFVHSRILRNQ